MGSAVSPVELADESVMLSGMGIGSALALGTARRKDIKTKTKITIRVNFMASSKIGVDAGL